MHNPFHDAFVQAARRYQPGPFSIHQAEQILPLRIDEGDRGQIHTHRVDPLSASSGPPAEFQLLHPRAGELPLKLEGHHTGFYFHVNFQHTKFFTPLSLFSKPRSSRRRRFRRMTGSTSSPHCTQRWAKKSRWPLSDRRSKHCSVTMRPPQRTHCAVLPSSSQPTGFASFRSSAGSPTAVAIAASHSTFRESEPCPDSIQRLLVRHMEHNLNILGWIEDIQP